MVDHAGTGPPIDAKSPAKLPHSTGDLTRNRTRPIIPDPAAGRESTPDAWNARVSVYIAGYAPDRKTGESTFGIRSARRTTTLEQHAAYIIGGTLKDATENARTTRARHGPKSDAYRDAKSVGQVVTWAGVFRGRRTLETLSEPSGLVLVDSDDLDGLHAAANERDRLYAHPAVAFSYVTMSGVGVQAVAAVSPTPSNAEEYRAAWRAVSDALSPLGNDIAVKDVSRPSFSAHDPNAKLRAKSEIEPINWTLPPDADTATAERPTAPKRTTRAVAGHPTPLPAEELEDIFEFAPSVKAAYEHDASEYPNIPPGDMSRWEMALANAYYIAGGQDDDQALRLMASHQLKHGRRIEDKDLENFYLRTQRKARDGRKPPAKDTDAKPADSGTDTDAKPADSGTNTDAAPKDSGNPEGATERKRNPTDELLLSLIDEHHAPSLFGAAERLVAVHAEKLLIASYPSRNGIQQGRVFTLTPRGLWRSDEPTLRAKLITNERRTIKLAVARDIDGAGELSPNTKNLLESHKSILNTRAMTALDHSPSVPGTWGLNRQKVKSQLTFAELRDMDSQSGYIGMENGVLSLATGEPLKPTEGRKHLVTMSTGVRFDPEARHAAIDQMTAHLGDDVAAFVWASFGRALWGLPETFTLLIGGTRTGKSTLTGALKAALGPYMKPFSYDLIRPEHDTHRKSGPSPERAMLHGPRIGIAHESASWDLDKEKLKALTSSGLDMISFQPKYMGEIEIRPTASLYFVANSLPRMDKWTPSLFVRLTAIPFTRPDHIDHTLKARVLADKDIAKAVLARLVRAAREYPPPHPLEKPPTIRAFEDELRKSSLDSVTKFCFEHLAHAPKNEKLFLREIWAAYCKVTNLDHPESSPQRGFGVSVRDAMELPYPAHSVRKGEKSEKGWKGLRLNKM